MDGIISFLRGIGTAIVAVFDFVIGFFQDLIYIIQLTGKFLLQMPTYFYWIPAELRSMLIVLLGIVVIYKIMGREG